MTAISKLPLRLLQDAQSETYLLVWLPLVNIQLALGLPLAVVVAGWVWAAFPYAGLKVHTACAALETVELAEGLAHWGPTVGAGTLLCLGGYDLM